MEIKNLEVSKDNVLPIKIKSKQNDRDNGETMFTACLPISFFPQTILMKDH